MIMKRVLSLILALAALCCPLLTSCQELEYTTGVTYKVYENGEGENLTDLISFYATSETSKDGKWEYSLESEGIFEEYLSNEETKTKSKVSVTYGTFILKPVSEGETVIAFDLKDSESNIKETVYYTLTSAKDEDGIFRITAELKEE